MVKLAKNQNLNENLPYLKYISATESIDSEGHQEDVVSRKKKKLTEKMREFQLDELERKWSKFRRKIGWKTNTVEDMLYFFKNMEAVREELQHFNYIFRIMLDVQDLCNSLPLLLEQQRDAVWLFDLDHNICSFKQEICSWIEDAGAEKHVELSSKQSGPTKFSSQSKSGTSSSKSSSRSLRENRESKEIIKMAELIAQAEYMEEKEPMEFQNLRI